MEAAVKFGQFTEFAILKSGQIIRCGFVCGFINFHTCCLEYVCCVLSATDRDQYIHTVIHKELCCLDSGTAMSLCCRIL